MKYTFKIVIDDSAADELWTISKEQLRLGELDYLHNIQEREPGEEG